MKPQKSSDKRPILSRAGFTLLEFIVSIAIIGVVVSLITMGIQRSREASRRITCGSHLRQLVIAMQNYESVHRVLPPGNSVGYSTHVFLLPYLDQQSLFDGLSFETTWGAPGADPTVRRVAVPLFMCPSDPASPPGRLADAATNYAGNYGTGVQRYGFNGMFHNWGWRVPGWPQGPLTIARVRDGISSTAAFGEILTGSGELSRRRTIWALPVALSAPDQLEEFAQVCEDLAAVTGGDEISRGRPWVAGQIHWTGYTHILPPNRPNCTNGGWVQEGSYSAGSLHDGGANVAMGDAAVRFVSDSIDRTVWRRIGSRDGGD